MNGASIDGVQFAMSALYVYGAAILALLVWLAWLSYGPRGGSNT